MLEAKVSQKWDKWKIYLTFQCITHTSRKARMEEMSLCLIKNLNVYIQCFCQNLCVQHSYTFINNLYMKKRIDILMKSLYGVIYKEDKGEIA